MELKYFQGPGRAEPIRIMLHAAGVDFLDTRFGYADWQAVKPTTPLGSVPVLTIDGTTFCQSVSLQRYAAKLADFYPTEDHKAALIVDEVMDVINEVMDKCPQGGTDEEKKEKRQAYQMNVMTKYFGLIESRIQEFGGGTTVCGIPSVADVHVMCAVQGVQSGFWDYIDTDFFKDYPGITACVEKITEHKKVKAYYDSLVSPTKDEV
jgi:prostaglandin-H2 D-isomerase / glutathione transferase